MTAFSSAVVLIRESSESWLILSLFGVAKATLGLKTNVFVFPETNKFFKKKTTQQLYTY